MYCVDSRSTIINARPSLKKCGYCKADNRLQGSAILAPQGFCPNAFYAVYPYLLALLYDAKPGGEPFTGALIIRCPNPDNPTTIKVKFRFKKTKVIFNFIENIARVIGLPMDVIDKLILLEVVDTNGQCSLKKGASFKINIPDMNKVCPAAFFSMYPLLSLYLQKNERSFKQGAAERLDFLCPDPKTNIIYEASFSKDGSASNLRAPDKPCNYLPDMSKYKLAAVKDVDCLDRIGHKGEATLDKLIPSGICPFVFNIAIPYIITLINGGHFKWRKDIDTVEAQCPCLRGQAVFEIRRDKSDFKKISLSFEKIGGNCPNGHQKGQSYLLDFTKIICPHLFVRVFPLVLMLEYVNTAEKFIDELVVTCPFKEKKAAYTLKMSPKN